MSGIPTTKGTKNTKVHEVAGTWWLLVIFVLFVVNPTRRHDDSPILFASTVELWRALSAVALRGAVVRLRPRNVTVP